MAFLRALFRSSRVLLCQHCSNTTTTTTIPCSRSSFNNNKKRYKRKKKKAKNNFLVDFLPSLTRKKRKIPTNHTPFPLPSGDCPLRPSYLFCFFHCCETGAATPRSSVILFHIGMDRRGLRRVWKACPAPPAPLPLPPSLIAPCRSH